MINLVDKDHSESVQILIAEDHPIIRGAILRILNDSPQIQVIGEAADGLAALQQVRDLHPAGLLLDMDLPVFSGIQVVRILRKEHPAVKILAFSVYDDLQYIQGVLCLGVAGYLIKDEIPLHLVRAVLSISHGLTVWLSDHVKNRMDSRDGCWSKN